MATKTINILVDEDTHILYMELLRERKLGERVKYVLGRAATAKMKKELKERK
jgi:hypothetical protein